MFREKTANSLPGASQGIGAALVDGLLNEYNVVATSRDINRSVAASANLIPVAGDIGKKETAAGHRSSMWKTRNC